MKLVITTTTMEDMELEAKKAMKLVVISAPGRRAGGEGYGAGGNEKNYRGYGVGGTEG